MKTEILKRLSEAAGIGHLDGATRIAAEELSKYAEVKSFGSIGLMARINKGKDKTLLFDAHIDEVGFIVTHIFENGFLRVTDVGRKDPRTLPAAPVTVHGKGAVAGVFASVPPHLAKGKGEVATLDNLYVDTGLGPRAKELIAPGDYVTFDTKFSTLSGSRVTGKSLDDRAAVACLAELAKRICDKDLPCNVVFLIAEQEELGTRGARTAAYATHCDEAVAIDVSFASAPDVPAHQCGRLGDGPMIGVSPILNKAVTDCLIATANEKGLPFQYEVMGGTTGTDADVISVTREGIPCGLVSIPLRNMHTAAEVIDVKDVELVCDLLEAYILKGGAL